VLAPSTEPLSEPADPLEQIGIDLAGVSARLDRGGRLTPAALVLGLEAHLAVATSVDVHVAAHAQLFARLRLAVQLHAAAGVCLALCVRLRLRLALGLRLRR
jgi:hypothetical protein